MLPMFKYDNRFCGWNTAIVVLLAVFVVAPAAAEEEVDALWAALTGGKLDFAFRLRYEHVDDEALRAGSKLDNADDARLPHRHVSQVQRIPSVRGGRCLIGRLS